MDAKLSMTFDSQHVQWLARSLGWVAGAGAAARVTLHVTMGLCAAVVAAACLLAVVARPAAAALPASVDGAPLPSLAPMLERAVPAVVNVSTTYTAAARNPIMDDPFFKWFFRDPGFERRYRGRSVGSGVIVDAAKGYILTNSHVVQNADEISVTLHNGTTLKARLVGSDPAVDLAVLAVPAERLTAMPIADSSKVKVGDFVVAIGNPFGLGQTVTSGIVSALGRSGLSIEGYEDFIQTDASINPGNSGGALVNLRGQLIGVNTAIYAPTGGNVGIGFAIPANMARTILGQIVRFGSVRRANIGLSLQELTPELARAFRGDLRRGGAVVADVQAGSPAARAGFRAGDIIVQMGERTVQRVGDYFARAAVLMVGDTIPVTVLRADQSVRLNLVLSGGAAERLEGRELSPLLDGMVLTPFENATTRRPAGVRIAELHPRSRGYAVGLRPGDVIVGINGRPVLGFAELRAVLRPEAGAARAGWVLRVFRAGRYFQVPLG